MGYEAMMCDVVITYKRFRYGKSYRRAKKNSNSLKIREKMLLKLFQWVSASIVIGNKSIGVTVELELPPPQKR